MVHQEREDLLFVDNLESERTSLAKVPEEADRFDKDLCLGVDLLNRFLALLILGLRWLGRRRPILGVGRQKSAQWRHHILRKTYQFENS